MSFLDQNQNLSAPNTPASFYNSEFPQPGPNETRVASFDPRQPNIWDPTQDQPQPQQPQQPGQDQQPTRVAADQTAQAGSFTTGTPSPPQPLLPPAQGPWGQFGLPAYRSNLRQTYIPAAPNRGPDQWGQDERYPQEMQSWEVPGVYLGVGQKLAQWGPGYIAPYAAQMGMFGGAWMRGYMRGQDALARQRHQQMTLAAQETQDRLRNMLWEYGQIHATFGDYDKSNKNYDNYRTALYNAAKKYHDDHMIAAIEQLGPDAANNLLNWYDAQYRDTAAANRARAKDEKEKESIGPWLEDGKSNTSPSGVPPTQDTTEPPPPAAPEAPPPAPPLTSGPQGATGATDDDSNASDLGTGASDPTGGGEAAPAPRSEAPPAQQAAAKPPEQPTEITEPTVQVASADEQQAFGSLPRGLYAQATPGELQAAGGQAPDYQVPQTPVMNQAAQQQFYGKHLSKQSLQTIDQLATDFLMGRGDPQKLNKMDPRIKQIVIQRWGEMQAALAGLESPNYRKTGDAVVKDIAAINQPLAQRLADVAHGDRDPPKGAALDRPPWDRYFGLLKKIDPNFSPDNVFTRRKTKQDFTPGGVMGKKFVAAGTAFKLGEQLREELKKGIPGITATQLAQWGRLGQEAAKYMDPESVRRLNYLQSLRREFIAEVETALAGGGAPRQTERLLQEEAYDPAHQSLDAIMGQLDGAYTALNSRLGELSEAYKAGTGWGPNKMLEGYGADDRRNLTGLGSHRGAGPAPAGRLPPGVTIEEVK